MKLLIVDDEPLARSRLRRLLEPLLPDWQVLEANHAHEAMSLVQQHVVDLAFLDMAMPGMTGLALAAELRLSQPQLALVFITAHAEHALDAYRVAPLDYLLKPVSRERLIETLTRLPMRQHEPALMYRHGVSTQRLLLKDVFVFHADEKYVRAVTVHGDVLLDQSLKQLEQMFATALVRVHRQTLVPRARIVELRHVADGGHQLVLVGTSITVAVSRRELAHVRSLLQQPVDTDSVSSLP